MAGEFKETESVGKYISSKFDYDLYNDEDNKKTQDESWRFFENSKKTIEIFANSFDEKELNFIRSPNGILFCLKIYKQNKDADFIIKNIKDFSKE